MAINAPEINRSTSFTASGSASFELATGGAPFTIEAWVRVDSVFFDNFTAIIYGNVDNSFILGVLNNGQSPTFAVACRGQFIVGPNVVFGEWSNLALAYDGQSITFIVDGGAYPSLALSPAPASAVVIGQQGTSAAFDVWDVSVYSAARTTLQVNQDMWAEASTSDPGLVFYGDFTVSPPLDLFGSAISVNGTGFNVETPNIRNLGTGYLLPAAASDLNPNFSAPFSVSLWTRAIPGAGAAGQTIYGNGDMANGGSWMIGYNNPGLELIVVTTQGPQSLALGQLSLDAWTHLAVTWDGTTCTMYVNGSPAQPVELASSSAVPAGQSILFNQMTNGAPSAPYAGHIQSLAAWNSCLTAQQVMASMYVDPSNDPACTAFFCCTISPPADLSSLGDTGVSGEDLLQLVGSGIAFDPTGADSLATPTQADDRERRPSDASAAAPGRSRPEPWEAVGQRPPLSVATPSVPLLTGGIQPFSDEHVDRMKRDLYAAMAGMRDPDARKRIGDAFEAEVTELFARARTDPDSIPKAFTYERREDRWVILWHREGAVEIVAEYDAAEFDQCTMWWITFLITLLNGFLVVFGMQTTSQRIRQIIEEDILGPTAFRNAVVAAMNVPVFTGGTMISVLGVSYKFGLLGKVFWTLFSALSWWAAGLVVAKLVTFFAPPPASTPRQAMVIGNTVVTVAQLVIQLQGYQGACPAKSPAASDPGRGDVTYSGEPGTHVQA